MEIAFEFILYLQQQVKKLYTAKKQAPYRKHLDIYGLYESWFEGGKNSGCLEETGDQQQGSGHNKESEVQVISFIRIFSSSPKDHQMIDGEHYQC
jgi:hypothetical protein